MKTYFKHNHGSHLLWYFAGWGTTPESVAHLVLPPDYDLLVCYDYQDLQFEEVLNHYTHIDLIAWSMGVWVAERIAQKVPLQRAIAINGTGVPMDNQYGIPATIFTGTLDGLHSSASELTRHKFERRMCENKAVLVQYQQMATRSMENISTELAALYQFIQQDQRTDLLKWDKALIATQDKIFTPQNQQNYWQDRCQVRSIEAGHYPFLAYQSWQQLLDL